MIENWSIVLPLQMYICINYIFSKKPPNIQALYISTEVKVSSQKSKQYIIKDSEKQAKHLISTEYVHLISSFKYKNNYDRRFKVRWELMLRISFIVYCCSQQEVLSDTKIKQWTSCKIQFIQQFMNLSSGTQSNSTTGILNIRKLKAAKLGN